MKNAYWFIAAGVALLIAFYAPSPYMAFSIYAFLLLVTLSHISSVAWLSGLDCERTVTPDTLQQGEEVAVEVTITNRRGWPIPWIYFEDVTPPGFKRHGDTTRLTILMPGRSVKLKYRLTCPRRGYHRIGPLVMESGDLFGLQKRFRTGKRQDYVSVLPTVAYIDTFNIAARRPQGPVRVSNKIYEDPTRISGVREYQPGDPLNRIHWKVSARTGDLFCKLNEPSSVQGGTLVLDLHKLSYGDDEKAESRMELAITTTASIAYLLQMSGEQLGMITNGRDAAEIARYEVASKQTLSRDDAAASVVGEGTSDRLSPLSVPTRRSPVQALQIVENLARIVPTDGLGIIDLLMSEFRRLPRDAALLPVVPRVTDKLALALAGLKLSGFAVSVFYINDARGYPEAAGRLAPHQIHVFHIEQEWSLHEISPARIGH
ncbi:MAG TPA: DUF58 domain-containing protein [Candidatus Hydrogenedentes bacterium]|nr:DUF58 domain-containing protein [Candidatus Hydrogenedentota bacterium]